MNQLIKRIKAAKDAKPSKDLEYAEKDGLKVSLQFNNISIVKCVRKKVKAEDRTKVNKAIFL